MGVELERNEGGQIHFQNLVRDGGRLVRRFSKDETGQYHFFDIVSDDGRMYEWPGWSGFKKKVEKAEKVHRGPPRPSPEELLDRFDIPFSRLGIDLEKSIIMMGFENYPSGEELRFVDKDSGIVNTELFFDEISRNPIAERREYKPSFLMQYRYESATIYHPILHKTIDGTEVVTRSWRIDGKFRRLYRDGIAEHFVIFDENWDPSSEVPRKWNGLLVESFYGTRVDQENASVNDTVEYSEKSRSYFFPETILIYTVAGDPSALTFSPHKKLDGVELSDDGSQKYITSDWEYYIIGKRNIRKEEIPTDLGKPKTLMF